MLTFEPESHTYTLDDHPLPSVTELVSVLGENFDEPDGDFELTIEAAKERGTIMHGYLEHVLSGGTPEDYEIPDAYAGYAEAVNKFLTEHEVTARIVETPMCGICDEQKYAGTPDCVGDMDGVFTLMDFKFVSQVAKSRVGAQLNAYLIALACNGIYPDEACAVQFMKDGKYRIYPARIDNADFGLCISIYKAKHKTHPRGKIG